jgi:L-ascorbate metabolism protein UlaG (beta-lactamase superfamily)
MSKKKKKPAHPLTTVSIPSRGMGIHWFGQSSFGIKSDSGRVLLTDPYFPRERPPEKFLRPLPPVDEAMLPGDVILLTHDHSDHTCIESLERLRASMPAITIVGPQESVDHMSRSGFDPVGLVPIAPGGTVELFDFVIHAVLSKLPAGSPERGISPPNTTHLGFVVEASGGRVYVSGDPQNDFADLEALVSPVAALRPDLGLLTTHPSEGEFPFFDGSARIARRIGLKAAMPAHYECFVKRTYDPVAWAAAFGDGTPLRVIIPYNGFCLYSASGNWVRCGY